MAGYEIVLRNETNEENKNPVAGSGASSTESGSDSTRAGKTVAKAVVTFNAYVKPFVSQLVNHRVQTIALRTGAEELQEKISFGYEIVNSSVNIVESIALGALVGNVAGAITGGLLSITTTAMSYANKAQQISWQRDVENVSLRGINIRAGGSLAAFSQSRGRKQ